MESRTFCFELRTGPAKFMGQVCAKILALGVALLIFWNGEAAAQKAPGEYEVKAAFLYNFLKYVEWPAAAFSTPNSPVTIGVLGADPFGALLDDTVADKRINERKIVVQRAVQFEDLKTCHLLFISQSEKSRVRKILADLKGKSVLAVSEVDSFAAQGGMVNFTMTGSKVRFEINVNAIQSAGLKASSKLLGVAKIVSPENR